MKYFSLVSFDNTHCSTDLGAEFVLLVQTSQILFYEAVFGKNGIVQAHACTLNHMLEVPSLTADIPPHRAPGS